MSGPNRTDDTGAGPVPVEQLTYTAASRELDAIVEFFEQREVDIDQLVTRLERATAIVDELDRRIRRTRSQVEELVPRLEAATKAASKAPGEDDAGTSEDDEDELFEADTRADEDLEEESESWDEDDEDDENDEGERPLF